MGSFEFRDYQNDAVSLVKYSYENGELSQIIQMAPGSGKTEVFVRLHSLLGLTKKTMILVHRDFLVEQAVEKLLQADPTISYGVEMASRVSDQNDQVVVCSVSTIGRKDGKRLSKFDPEEFDLIISDECHHAVSPQWSRILEYFDVLPKQENKHKILSLGVTATVPRLDGKSVVGDAFKLITYELGIVDAIEAGHLVPPIAYKVETAIDISGCKTTKADFVVGELEKLINVAQRNELIYDSYKKYLEGIKTIGFAHSVAHAKDLTDLFTKKGVKTACIIAETDSEERKAIFEKFNGTEVDVIFNVGTLTEGLNLPICGGILYCKATLSWALYYQSVTRALRKHENKDKAVIIDFYDSSEKHSIIAAPAIFGAPPGIDCEGEDVLEVVKELKQKMKEDPTFDPTTIKKISQARTKTKEVYNLLNIKTAANTRNLSTYFWCYMWDGSYRIQPDRHVYLSIKKSMTNLGKFDLYKNKELIFSDLDIRAAFRRGDSLVRQLAGDKLALLRIRGDWRHEAAGPKQVALLCRHGLPRENVLTLNKGTANKFIAKLLINEALRKRIYIN